MHVTAVATKQNRSALFTERRDCFWGDLKGKTSKDPLSIVSRCNSSWVYREFRSERVGTSIEVEKTNDTLKNFQMASAEVIASLKACAQHKDLHKGTRVHEDILKTGLLEQNCYVANSLVSMYAKCGALTKAAQVLCELPVRDVVSCNALIAGYAQQGQGEEALKCFEWMQNEGISPNAITFTCILKACGSIRAADKGLQIHNEIVRQGLLGKNVVLGSALVDMYAKCGALEKAHGVLDELPVRGVVAWSTLIAGYVQQGKYEEAMKCFDWMQSEGVSPNAVTFTCILKAYASIGAAEKGQQIHNLIVKQGLLGRNIVLGNALVDMYVKCGALKKARQVLDELPSRGVVSWSTLIAGYAQQGLGEEAIDCFKQMQQEGLCPNAVTFTCILKACGSIGAADEGREFHNELVRQGLLGKDVALGNALVDMYAKCGALEKARQVLGELPVPSVVSWSALIAGYAQQGQGEEALKCLKQMQQEGLSPNAVTFTCILKACGSVGAANKGQQIHDEIVRQGLLGKNIVLDNALVAMYAKCGALDKAQRVLDELPIRDVVSLNALIAGYAQQGHGEEALKCFKRMQRDGLPPDAVTFTSILKACGSIGAADEGQEIHDEIVRQGLLGKNIVLGNALVDMYAKCGALRKAQEVLDELPFWDVITLNSLMAGYAQQGQGEKALKCLEWMQHVGLSPDAVTFTSVSKACSS